MDIPVLYLSIYKKLKERARGGTIITYLEIMKLCNDSLYHFPKAYKFAFIKELEMKYGLIKKLDRKNYQVSNTLNDQQLEKIQELLDKITSEKQETNYELTGKPNIEKTLHEYSYALWGV